MKKEKQYKCISELGYVSYEKGKVYKEGFMPAIGLYTVVELVKRHPDRWERVEEKPTNEELIKEAKKRYSQGDIINQGKAYDMRDTRHKIGGKSVKVTVNDDGWINVSFGGVGVWHSQHKIWAEIITPKTEVEALEEKYNKREAKQKKLAAKIAEAKKDESKPKDYELHTESHNNGTLYAQYTENGATRVLARISSDGECKILNNNTQIENYELWREKGMKVCSDKVEWRGKTYSIEKLANSAPFLVSSEFNGNIYNFNRCEASANCDDDNIQRFKHNDKAIIF